MFNSVSEKAVPLKPLSVRPKGSFPQINNRVRSWSSIRPTSTVGIHPHCEDMLAGDSELEMGPEQSAEKKTLAEQTRMPEQKLRRIRNKNSRHTQREPKELQCLFK